MALYVMIPAGPSALPMKLIRRRGTQVPDRRWRPTHSAPSTRQPAGRRAQRPRLRSRADPLVAIGTSVSCLSTLDQASRPQALSCRDSGRTTKVSRPVVVRRAILVMSMKTGIRLFPGLLRVGETGFEPATARPPAGLQGSSSDANPYPIRVLWRGLVRSCAQFDALFDALWRDGARGVRALATRFDLGELVAVGTAAG